MHVNIVDLGGTVDCLRGAIVLLSFDLGGAASSGARGVYGVALSSPSFVNILQVGAPRTRVVGVVAVVTVVIS